MEERDGAVGQGGYQLVLLFIHTTSLTSVKNGCITRGYPFVGKERECDVRTPGTFLPVMEEVRVVLMSNTFNTHGSLWVTSNSLGFALSMVRDETGLCDVLTVIHLLA